MCRSYFWLLRFLMIFVSCLFGFAIPWWKTVWFVYYFEKLFEVCYLHVVNPFSCCSCLLGYFPVESAYRFIIWLLFCLMTIVIKVFQTLWQVIIRKNFLFYSLCSSAVCWTHRWAIGHVAPYLHTLNRPFNPLRDWRGGGGGGYCINITITQRPITGWDPQERVCRVNTISAVSIVSEYMYMIQHVFFFLTTKV